MQLNEPAEFLQGKEKDEAVHVQIRFKRMTKQESQTFWGSLSDLSPALRRLGTGGRNRKPERMSLPSPLLSRNGSNSDLLYTSSSEHCLEQSTRHEESHQCPSPVISTKLSANAKTQIGQHKPPSFHITPSNPMITGNQMPHKQFSLDGSSYPHGTRKRSSLEKSLKVSSQATTSHQNSKQPFESVPRMLILSDSDSLCSSKSSPSLLKEALGSSASRSTLHSSTLSLTSSDRDLKMAGWEKASRETETLDLYILNPNTDFYHQLCAAWQDQKIVCIKAPTPSCR